MNDCLLEVSSHCLARLVREHKVVSLGDLVGVRLRLETTLGTSLVFTCF